MLQREELRANAVWSGSLAQWTHQVTAAALIHLQGQSFTAYKDMQQSRL